MTIPNVDISALTALTPNLNIGDIADPALRLAAFQYLYAELAVIVAEVNNLPTANFQNLAITTAKINDLAVTTGKIAALAVTTAKLNDLSVTLEKMAADSVGTSQLVDLSVTTEKIAVGAVGADQLDPTLLENVTVAFLQALLVAHEELIASTTILGHVMVDGTTITIDSDGVISSIGGGGSSETVTRTITVGVGKNFTTIQAAINSVAKNILNGVTVTIQADAKTYAEDLVIDRFFGSGSLSLLGATTTTTTHNVTSITTINCHIDMVVKGFNVTSSLTAVSIIRTLFVALQNLNIINSATGSIGIYGAYGSAFMVSNSVISNRSRALHVFANSHVASFNNSGTGNVTSLDAQLGSVIAKNGTQPAGTTAEAALTGGVIR